ncbi:unnamed protein product, partial [Sphacelaria rigidula]
MCDTLTPEQRAVVNSEVGPSQILKILASAGTGKTFCLRAWAQSRPHLRILYIAFNNAVARDAQGTFSKHVTCSTIHSIAFRAMGMGRRYKTQDSESVTFSLKVSQLREKLPLITGG